MRVPFLAQNKPIVSVEIIGVRSYFSCHLYQSIQANFMTGFDAVFCYCRFLKFVVLHVMHMLLVMVHPVWPTYTLPHFHAIQYVPGTRPPRLSFADLSKLLLFLGT